MAVHFVRSSEAALEICHHGLDGSLHGHSLIVVAYTHAEVDLDAWQAKIADAIKHMENGPLEDTVGRTFEDVAIRVLDRLPEAHGCAIRLLTRGHVIEAWRT